MSEEGKAEREKEKVGEEVGGGGGGGGGGVVNTFFHSLFKKVLLWSND